MKKGLFWLIGVGVLILFVLISSEHEHQQTFHPFNVPVGKVLVDYSYSSPNGNGQGYEVSQLKPFDIHEWVKKDNKHRNPKWIRGPITDPEHLRIIEFTYSPAGGDGEDERSNAAISLTWQELVRSPDVYVYFKDVKYFGGESKDIGSALVWILDAKDNKMYFAWISI